MTDAEFEKLEKLRETYDKKFCETVQKFFHHPAVHHGMDSVTLRRLIYPVIFSEKPDAEIIAELDKLAPPGKRYF